MRKFSSYGPVDKELNYYAPREDLIQFAYQQLLGENPDKGGHYITVWGPRQTGKTWLMQQILADLRADNRFAVVKINLQHLKEEQDSISIINTIAEEIAYTLHISIPKITVLKEFQQIFRADVLAKPLILMLDEFDALNEKAIGNIVNVLRNIYIHRQDQSNKITEQKDYLLHGVALIGVRAVLGVENVAGSPFNVQRGLHIPNLTADEVTGMFRWYEQDSGQQFEPDVIERVYYEFRGQPGLTCWFGELLTETYNEHHLTITMLDFDIAYAMATNALPNNNILNIISKAKQEPYKDFVLEMFRTEEKRKFGYDDPIVNFLYMNGVIDQEVVNKKELYLKFPCPFVQKRLFNTFARDLFRDVGRLYDPFEDLSDTITDTSLNIKALLKRYQTYLQQNRSWLLRDAPRRKTDLRIYEAVYHFNLYVYLQQFLNSYHGQVYPEFPTGNGQIDLIIRYEGQMYGLEVKSFSNQRDYKEALLQATAYGQQLGLAEITLAFFVERVDEANRSKYEVIYHDAATGITVIPVFVEIEI